MKRLLLVVILVVLFSSNAFSQGGMKFAELAKRLENYFNKEMILDIQRNFPQGSDYSIWGWDVGDFSGDGVPDAAFSVRVASQKGRTMQVYLFVDIDGFFVKAGQFAYEFVELPLEIGVVIRDNACYITRKNKLYDWLIRGYRFDNGSIIHLDEFTTKRYGNLTNESYKNYETLKNTEKYLDTRSGKAQFFAEYHSIPSYRRGRYVYKGYHNEAFIDDINYVPKGAFWWEGTHDLSYRVSSVYDDEFLYMTVKVKDDAIVPQYCDTCISDYVEVWFDMTPNLEDNDRFAVKSNERVRFKETTDSGLYCITIFPGNYTDKSATVKVSTTDNLEPYQKLASHNIVAISDVQDSIYVIKFKVPFAFFGLQGNPAELGQFVEYGCTVSVHDYDNEFRPEEYTKKNTSVFDPQNPSTYGSIVLVPNDKWYGAAQNIYQEDILKTLMEYGF